MRFGQLMRLFGWTLRHPLWMFAAAKATARTMQIVQEKFPDIHGKDNKANAFRHALWNALIASNCYRIKKDVELVLSWTQRITDWHEDFSPNKPLARAMDIHNNQIGRGVFRECLEMEEQALCEILTEQLTTAVQIASLEEMQKCSDNLIYIENDI